MSKPVKMLPDFKILEFGDVQKQIEHIHLNGWEAGYYVGFPHFEPHYNLLPGCCTDITGYPQSGKTELWLEILLNTAHFYGLVHMLWLPDVGRSVDIMIKLIHKYTGKGFKRQYSNFIEIEEVWKSHPWLMHHFRIIHPTSKRTRRITPLQLWEFAAEYREKVEPALASITTDSWKDLKHNYADSGGGIAPYLADVLSDRNMIAEQTGLHIANIVHPKNPERVKGKLAAPFPDDMAGGAQWNDNGKCILSVHRENWDDGITDIYFRKIKPEQVGRPTMKPVPLNFDVKKSRFFWIEPTTYRWIYAEGKDSDSYKDFQRTSGKAAEVAPLPQTAIDFTESKREEEASDFF